MPPSSTFMLGVPTFSADGVLGADSDVPLLGPMPPYAMQGSGQRGQHANGSAAQSDAYVFGRPDQQHPQAQQPHVQMEYSTVPNMDLNELLGGEEWVVAATAGGNFLPQLRQRADSNAIPITTDGSMSFDDLSPGTLGWRPEGY